MKMVLVLVALLLGLLPCTAFAPAGACVGRSLCVAPPAVTMVETTPARWKASSAQSWKGPAFKEPKARRIDVSSAVASVKELLSKGKKASRPAVENESPTFIDNLQAAIAKFDPGLGWPL